MFLIKFIINKKILFFGFIFVFFCGMGFSIIMFVVLFFVIFYVINVSD